MLSLLILFLPLVVLMFFSLNKFKYILSPAFSFVVGFVIQIFICFFYVDEWKIQLSGTTICIILLGCTTFVMTSWLLKNCKITFAFYGKKKFQNVGNGYKESFPLFISQWKLILFAILQTFTLLSYIFFMNVNMPGLNLSMKIYAYRSMTADYGEIIEIPKILSFFRLISSAIGYCLLYSFAYNLANKFKQYNILIIINLMLSIFIEGILGARGGIFNFIIAFFGLYLLINYKYRRLDISISFIIKIIASGIAIIMLLPILGNALGRPMSNGAFYSIAVYIGGPLVNLDSFIKTVPVDERPHFSTIYNLIYQFPEMFSEKFISKQKLPNYWNFINGYTTGNVFTTYSNFWFDFGWGGIVLLPMIAAIIMHILYKQVMEEGNHRTNQVSISAVLYAYLMPCILFSFFGNRFYVQLFSIYMVKFIIAVIAVKIFIEKIMIKSIKI